MTVSWRPPRARNGMAGDDAVVPLADDRLRGARLPGLSAARAPASRARGSLGLGRARRRSHRADNSRPICNGPSSCRARHALAEGEQQHDAVSVPSSISFKTRLNDNLPQS